MASNSKRFSSLAAIDMVLYLLVLALCFLPPLVFSGRVYYTEHFRAPKNLLSSALLCAATGFWLILRLEGWYRRIKIPRLLGGAAVAFLLWNAVSLSRLKDFRAGIDSLLNLLLYMMAWRMAIDVVNTRRRLLGAVLGINLAVWLTAAYSFFQLFSMDPLFTAVKSEWSGHMLITGMLGNPNLMACLLALGGPYLLHLGLFSNHKNFRPTIFVGLVLLIHLILASYTRAAMAGLIVGLGLYALLVILKAKQGERKSLARSLKITAGIIVFVIVMVLTTPGLRSRFTSIDKADTLFHRLFIFRTTLTMVRDHPLMGVGLGGFKLRYYDYQAARLRENLRAYEGLLYEIPYQTHNDYLQVLAETGFPGLLLLLLMVFALARSWRRAVGAISERTDHSLAVAGMGATVAVLVDALFNFPFHVSALALPAIFSAAVPLISAAITGDPGRGVHAPQPRYSLAARRLIQVLVIGLMCKGVALQINTFQHLVWVTRGLQAFDERRLPAARQAFLSAHSLRSDKGEVFYNLGLLEAVNKNYGKAIEYFEKVQDYYRDYKIHTAYAITLEAMGRIPDALHQHEWSVFFTPRYGEGMENYLDFCLRNRENLPPEALERAVAVSRKSLRLNESQPHVALKLGELLYAQGDLHSAEKYLKLVILHDTCLARAHYNLGKIMQRTDRAREAAQCYSSALLHDPELTFLQSDYEKERVRRAARLIEQSDSTFDLIFGLRDMPESPDPASPEPALSPESLPGDSRRSGS